MIENTMEQTTKEIAVRVLDGSHNELSDVNVLITSDHDAPRTAAYDIETRLYRTDVPSRGRVTITVSRDGFEPQSRSVPATRLPLTVKFMLGRPGDAYVWLDGVRVPYTPFPEEIAVIADEDWKGIEEVDEKKPARVLSNPDKRDSIQRRAQKTFIIEHGLPGHHDHTMPQGTASSRAVRLSALRKAPGVHRVARIFAKHEDGVSIITDTVIVTFGPQISGYRATDILRSHGLTKIGSIPGSEGSYIATADPEGERESDAILDALMELPEVESVSVNIMRPAKQDVINPNDFLWQTLWDRKLVRCPDAWQDLQTNAGGKTFGDPNITIGIFDSGVKTQNQGEPIHEDLLGVVDGNAHTTLRNPVSPTRSTITVLAQAGLIVGNVIDVGLDREKEIHDIIAGAGTEVDLVIDALHFDAPAGAAIMLHAEPNAGTLANVPRTWLKTAKPAATDVIDVVSTIGFNVGDRITIGSAIWNTVDAITEEVTIISKTVDTFTITPVAARDRLGGYSSHPTGADVDTRRKTIISFDSVAKQAQNAGGATVNVAGWFDHDLETTPTTYLSMNHGLLCATIALGKANNLISGSARGVVGSAPDSRLVALRPFSSVDEYIYMLTWAAGLGPHSMATHATAWPVQRTYGIDILSSSIALGFGITPPDRRTTTIDRFIDYLTRRGRGGRGLLLFFSAGNESIAQGTDRWSAHPRIFCIGATGLSYDGSDLFEVRARYSNYANATGIGIQQPGWITFSAPSSYDDLDRVTHNHPTAHFAIGGVIPKVTIGTTSYQGGDRIGHGATTTQLANNVVVNGRTVMKLTAWANPTTNVLEVDTIDSVNVNDWLYLGWFPEGEWVQVHPTTAPALKKITLVSAPGRSYPAAAAPRAPITVKVAIAVTIPPPAGSPADRVTIEIPWNERSEYIVPKSVVIITSTVGSQYYEVKALFAAASPNHTTIQLTANLTGSVAAGSDVKILTNVYSRVLRGTDITVANSAGFLPGDWIQLGDPAESGSEPVNVYSVTGNVLKISGPLNTYNPTVATPVNVHRGNQDYWDRFGGTSAATPLAAGVAALVLAAKPSLTWVEVREVLRISALPVDLTCHDVEAALAAVGDHTASPEVDGRWMNEAGVPIVDTGGNLVLLSDDPDIEGNPTSTTLVLDDAGSMYPGHAVVVKNQAGTQVERRIILDVDAGTDTITLDQPLTYSYSDGTATTGKTQITANALTDDTTIQVASSASFVVGQTIEIDGDQVRVIRAIPDDTHLTIDPLAENVGNGDSVEGGHIPWRSRFYGFGRVDAAAAVEKARTYSHNARDLMIRNNPSDDGVTPITDLTANPVNSPDIWGRITAPGGAGVLPADDTNALPRGYKVVGYNQDESYANLPPHERPLGGQDYYLYARIKNRGDSLHGLEAWARFYIYRTRANEPFRVPKRFNDTRTASDIPDNVSGPNRHYGPSGVFFIGQERPLFDAIPDGDLVGQSGGIPHGAHLIVKTQWNAADLPSTGVPKEHRLRTHVVVEVTPYDGELAGETLGRNNNISSREITFAQVEFKKDNNDPLPDEIRVKRSGGDTPLAFTIKLSDAIGYFRVSKVKVIGTRYTAAGASETVQYEWTGSPLAWNSTPATPGWFTVGGPKLPGGADAVSADDEIEISFTGSLNVSHLHDRVDIKLVLESHNDVVLLEELVSLPVEPIPVNFNDLDVGEPNEPSIYTFADMAGLTHTKAFGPIDALKFQVTSAFTAAAGTKAYAIAAGELMVQRVADATGYDATRVNVIVRPFNAPRMGSRAVKYFIYRGIRLLDFFDSAANDADLHGRAEKSEFIAYIYKTQQLRHDAFLATDYGQAHTAEAPPLTLKSTALGWDTTVAATTSLDPSFFGDANAPQLPVVPAGMQIGEFESGAECGFEVVLETDDVPFTYEFARLRSKVIDVSGDTAGSFAQRYHREEILRYVDPAAYYGILFDIGVYTKSGGTRTLKKGGDLYTDVLSRFLSKNRIYVDVRNEADASFDFYGNYAVNGFHLKYGVKAGETKTRAYPTKEWPVLVLERSQAERASDKVYLALSMKENPKPAVYIEEGTPTTPADGGSFVVEGKLFAAGSPWTKEIGFKINQHTVSGNKQDVATILMLDYGRRVDPARVWPTPSPIAKFEQYTDNMFGPLNGLQPYAAPPGNSTRWRRLNDLKLVDATDNDPVLSFGSIAERGVAYQPGQVLFFCSALGYYKRNGGATNIVVGTGLEGGFGPQPNLFAASLLFSRLDVETVQVHHNPGGGAPTVLINISRLVPNVPESVAESVLVLGLKDSEYDALIGLLPQLSDKHPKNIVLREDLPPGATHLSDGTTDYHRYFVELRGLDDGTAMSKDVAPSTPIAVYSVDGLSFVSAGFDATKLIPDEYMPDHEESRALGKPEPEDRIEVDGTMGDQITLFGNALNQVLEGSTSAPDDLESAVLQYATTIFDQARTFSVTPTPGNTYPDDRPLYWTRLRMAIALKGHPVVRKNAALRDRLVHDFEWISRGMLEDLFQSAAGRKKILLCGTDPVGLNDDITASNPSAVAALDLHNEQIDDSGGRQALVKSILLPLRYDTYEGGLIDDFFTDYLYQTPADMILVLSQNGASGWFDVDRFAGRKRGDGRDNDDHSGLIPVGSGTGWDEFYETTLPVNNIMTGRTSESPQIVYYDQSYKANASGVISGPNHPRNGGSNLEQNDPAITLGGISGTAEAGSAGNFIPNEIFYRLMHLRATPPSGSVPTAVKVGHISVPTPVASGKTMSAIVEEIRKILRQSLAGL